MCWQCVFFVNMPVQRVWTNNFRRAHTDDCIYKTFSVKIRSSQKKSSDPAVLMTHEWSCADLAKVIPEGSAMGSRHLALARRLPHRRVGSQRMMQSWKDMVIIRTQHEWWSEWQQRKRSKLWSLWLKPLCILCLSCHQRNLGSDGLIYVGKKNKI